VIEHEHLYSKMVMKRYRYKLYIKVLILVVQINSIFLNNGSEFIMMGDVIQY